MPNQNTSYSEFTYTTQSQSPSKAMRMILHRDTRNVLNDGLNLNTQLSEDKPDYFVLIAQSHKTIFN